MNKKKLEELLTDLRDNNLTVEEVMESLKTLPFEDIGIANIDHHRELRKGTPEVIFGQGKRVEDIISIMKRMYEKDERILVTRLSDEKAEKILKEFPESKYHERCKALTLTKKPVEITGRGTILVICAGTSDIPVAEEAAVTAGFMGNRVEIVNDIGVAGLHRILARKETLFSAEVLIVVAGMEGALPSVIGGLVDKPVIAVPTSVGYGASFGGIAALLGMLNSCASGVTVVNIDNGFGAGYAASVINRKH
ncbi:MAG: nickel pincer cofactor biosynthesis protein LarB [Desulfatiglans sp.]|nr:nickel pincer cofactor biosynthesis protein LarB [Desulfatiglans sp.]